MPSANNEHRHRERLLTAREAADRLNVTLDRVYALVRSRKLPGVRLGRSVRVDRATLERYIEDGGSGAELSK
ncbi:MAG: helix-turn-helix domain-containing protein [Longimicrobiales bacterium]